MAAKGWRREWGVFTGQASLLDLVERTHMWEVGLPSLLPATVQVATEGTAAGD